MLPNYRWSWTDGKTLGHPIFSFASFASCHFLCRFEVRLGQTFMFQSGEIRLVISVNNPWFLLLSWVKFISWEEEEKEYFFLFALSYLLGAGISSRETRQEKLQTTETTCPNDGSHADMNFQSEEVCQHNLLIIMITVALTIFFFWEVSRRIALHCFSAVWRNVFLWKKVDKKHSTPWNTKYRKNR